MTDWIEILCALAGFFGWFGLGHLVAVRPVSRAILYLYACGFLAHFFVGLKGPSAFLELHRDFLLCASALVGLALTLSMTRDTRLRRLRAQEGL